MRAALLCVLFLLAAAGTRAQVPEYISITDLQALPCNEIYDIHFDKKGYLWMGTEIGIFRYNGKTYQSFHVNKAAGQPVTGITEAGDKKYAHNFLGDVFQLKGDSLLTVPIGKEVLKMGYTNTARGFNDQLWIGTDQGLFYYDTLRKSWQDRTPGKSGVPPKDHKGRQVLNPYAVRNVISRDDEIWATNLSHIFRVTKNGTTLFRVNFAPGADDQPFHYFLAPGEQGVWLNHISGGGVYRLVDSAFELYYDKDLYKLIENKSFTHLKEIGGKLFFMAYDGLLIHDLMSKKTEWLFRDRPITDMEFDKEGNIWLSTLGYGLLYCPSLEIRSLKSSRQPDGRNKITYLCPAPGGGMYFSHFGGGMGWITHPSQPARNIDLPVNADISTMWMGPDSTAYVSLNNQVFRVKNGRYEQVPVKFPATKDLYMGTEGIYIASSSGLFYAKTLKDFETEHRILSSWCKRLCIQGKSGIMWVGASDGLHMLRGEKVIRSFFKGEGVQDMVWVEEEQTLYCALLSGKIMRLKNGVSTQFRFFEQTERQVYRIRWLKGELWLATSKGVGRMSTAMEREIWYNIFDGLSSNVVYDLFFHANTWWLATGNGIQVLPADVKKNSGVPRIFLRRVRVNQKVVTDPVLKIRSSDEVAILLDVLSYYSRGEFQLSYSFGEDKWIRLPQGQREFVLSSISSQYNQLQVRVMDAKGERSLPLTIQLNVHPPYWQSPWFYVGLVVLTFLIVSFVYSLNLNRVKKRQENALEKAQLQTNLISSQLTALKAQMNPHFIFNSLNSIYEMIIFSETKEAANYLSKFAILLRKVLENSEKETLPLNEELEWLTLYLELEKLRFGSDFSYQINTEKVNELYGTLIPTMLLQPFVENAVKHGLLHKEGIKRLEIDFYEKGNYLVCEILDNGVGRAQAAEYRKGRGETHKSFATGAIQRRIEMLNSSGKFEIELHTDDLEFPNGKSAGTLVRITIQGW